MLFFQEEKSLIFSPLLFFLKYLDEKGKTIAKSPENIKHICHAVIYDTNRQIKGIYLDFRGALKDNYILFWYVLAKQLQLSKSSQSL